MTTEGREAELKKIASQIRSCTRCKLHENRTTAVPGSGPADANVFFLGEGPGAREDEQGLPFVGRSGRYLDQLLEGIDLDREKVFITNVVKCRPPSNRDPYVAEVQACAPYLDRQLEIIQPRLVVTLGRFAMEHFISDGRISDVHGEPRHINDTIYLPLYHPAAALYRGSLRRVMEDDFRKIPELLDART
jgi:DNA polymerase